MGEVMWEKKFGFGRRQLVPEMEQEIFLAKIYKCIHS